MQTGLLQQALQAVAQLEPAEQLEHHAILLRVLALDKRRGRILALAGLRRGAQQAALDAVEVGPPQTAVQEEIAAGRSHDYRQEAEDHQGHGAYKTSSD